MKKSLSNELEHAHIGEEMHARFREKAHQGLKDATCKLVYMKLAIIGDGHHFQSFVKNYDSLYDLKKILQRIKQEESPDVLLIARDMFDFMKTSTAYLRHYQGEGLTIRVRNILRSFGLPVYAIRGQS